ncbi:MAG: threonylcarbamoyl-AMP synthase [Clostridia bacterium]|nr:threonylcarbamoyl-AMP synthase [Clostridia bacterium]
MITKIFSTTEDDLREAGRILKNGGLVAFPTETVYGLGADALNPEAAKKVYLAKGRPSDNPMIVHIQERGEIYSLTDTVSDDVKVLMESFWPGPLTIIVKAKDIIPRVTTGGLSTVAVRMPSSEIARKVIRYSGCPIAAPSANLSGKPSPTKGSHCVDDMNGRIDGIILGPDCEVGIESTVIDMTGDSPEILRPGIITREEISLALNKEVKYDRALFEKPGEDFSPKAPGMKYKHYAPKAEMILFKGEKDKVRQAISLREKEETEKGKKVSVILFDDNRTAAHDLFMKLRQCDLDGTDLILCEALTEEGLGFSVMNRMLKSASYNVVEI